MLDSPTIQRLETKLDLLVLLLDGKTPEYYTVIETANLLRCSKSTIRDKMRTGKLPFSRLGDTETSTILIRRKDLEGLLRK